MSAGRLILWVGGLCLVCAPGAVGAVLPFSDDFNSGASAHWGNERGNWAAVGGVYDAGAPNNNPLTASLIDIPLTSFALDVDINNVSDGGLWLRADAGAHNGILLVTKPGQLYWHIVTADNAGSILNPANPSTGSNPHLKVIVSGDTYWAYVNGSATPATTLTTSARSSGFAGLYDFSGQTFDNVVLVPEPGVMGGLVAAGCTAGLARRGGRRADTRA
jgi:hypothetical protein